MTQTLLDPIPAPVLYNPWKHHANWVGARIGALAVGDAGALPSLAGGLVVIGTRLMDLYVGDLGAAEVAAWAVTRLASDARLAPTDLAAWLDAGGGYRLLSHPADGSVWAIRLGDSAERHVHLHPGRHAPRTVRANAATLKTAVMALASARIDGADSVDLARVNRVRREFLGLPPVSGLAASAALTRVLTALSPGRTGSAGSPSRSSAPGEGGTPP